MPATDDMVRTGADTGGTVRRGSYPRFVALLLLAVLSIRTFACAPFTIPSESMLPTLQNGDYLIAAKWPYGYSRYSFPFDASLVSGTFFAKLPERGDVAIFRHEADGAEYIKRVIGLPGDRVAMRGGAVELNGKAIPRQRIADFSIAQSPNTPCAWGATRDASSDGRVTCRYVRYRETLPGGRSYEVLDFGATPQDRFGPITVPVGHIFLLGDNRDNSQDSRFPPRPNGGVGLVPAEMLVARAGLVLFSSDGSAVWYDPLSWVAATRWHRTGERM